MRWSASSSLSPEAISYTVYGLDIAGHARLWLDLCPEILDMCVDRTLISLIAYPLDDIEQVQTRVNPAGRCYQRGQDIELRGGEVYEEPAHTDSTALTIQEHVSSF
jgi:hypothetical protein